MPPVQPGEVETFAKQHQTHAKRPVIGMVTRFAAEKGVEVLLDALPTVLKRFPRAQVLFAGQYQDVLGESAYAARLMPRIQEFEQAGAWKFLGVLSPQQLAAFYPNLDALVVPSLNSTEAFGLVQVEAMMNNIPCIASALPGVRRPVQLHGMGEVVPIGDPVALAEALLQVFTGAKNYKCNTTDLIRQYDPDVVASKYEILFERLGGSGQEFQK
jgi:glycosyltransferase involved in cell wall biosynthesis